MGCQDAVVTAFLLSPERDKAGHLQGRQKAERVSLHAVRGKYCLLPPSFLSSSSSSPSSSSMLIVSSCTFFLILIFM